MPSLKLNHVARLIAAGVMRGAAAQYYQTVKSVYGSSLVAYWPIWEPSGATVAADVSGNGRNGAYDAGDTPTLGVTGIGDGRTAGLFDGSNDNVNIYSASLRAALPGAEGTLSLWFQVSALADWTESTKRYLMSLYCGGTNEYIWLYKSATNGLLVAEYRAGGVAKSPYEQFMDGDAWTHVCMTWSKSNDRVRIYVNGRQASTFAATGLGTWGGTLDVTTAAIGALSSGGTSTWKGKIAHVALGNRELSEAENYATVSPILSNVDALFVGDSKALNNWIHPLCYRLNSLGKVNVYKFTGNYCIGGYTWALMHTYVDTNIAAAAGSPRLCLLNLGANDVSSLPAEATIKADITGVIDPIRAKWPGCKIYIARPWRRGYATECNTLAGYIADIVTAYSSPYVALGMDERVWLEGGDNGVTMTSDGTHYSAAGYAAAVTAWLAVVTSL